MTKRDWWIGIALVVAALLAHAALPRYEWRETLAGRPGVRIDRWTGRAVWGVFADEGRWISIPDLTAMQAAKNATDAKTKAEAEDGANATAKKSGADDGWLSIADVVRVPAQSTAPTGSFDDDLTAIRTPTPVTPPPATPFVSTDPTATDVIAAKDGGVRVAEPRAKGSAHIRRYTVEDIVHSDPPLVRPTTGYEWQMPSNGGRGELSVTNGTGKDGVAELFERLSDDSLRARRAVYVRAQEDASLHGIAPGTYLLRFMLGMDWNDDGRVRFTTSIDAMHAARSSGSE